MAPAPASVLAINGGSSSIKFALFDGVGSQVPRKPFWSGKVDGIAGPQSTSAATGSEAVQLALDPARPIVSEAESSKIGNLSLPPSLWAIMQAAPRIEVTAEPQARARYLARAYADLRTTSIEAATAYVADVRAGTWPDDEHSFH